MITLERTSMMNLDNAIRGARNPMNSWDRMDSKWLTWEEGAKEVYDESLKCPNEEAKYFCLGENDLGLAVRLRKAGSDHRKYLRQIFVSVDINAPWYWWKEQETYKVGTVANSYSTMHKITSKPITLEMFSVDEDCLDETRDNMQHTVDYLEKLRLKYLSEEDEVKKKRIWRDLIQSIPSSFNQMRTVSLNYENLVNMYHARKNHKLSEWHTFCDWVRTLPYAKELIICEE